MSKLQAPLLALLLFCLAIGACFSARAEIAVPALTGHVIDQTATLSSAEISQLEQLLRDFEAKKGSQVAVLIVPTTEPEAIEQYSIRVAEEWKLGRKKIDDGAILLIAKNDRALRIEVGYGLEGALTDIASKRIISEIITPHFKQGDFNAGITAGVQQIMRVIDGEPLPAPTQKSANGAKDTSSFLPVIVLVAFVVGGTLRAILGKFLGALATGGIIGIIVWIFISAFGMAVLAGLAAFLFTLFSNGGGGGGRGWGGGGGFGGGSLGGGGFSGGGGGFGGGGASGRW
ncbi:MAG TPA: YgcG family protein [Cellvibrio sp.]|nr:YgcG family protein [Cellvibrio sp.]